jgi:hypothetical protein
LYFRLNSYFFQVGADVTFCTCSVVKWRVFKIIMALFWFKVTICVISADRYLAVTRPLRYKSVITKFKIIVVIICIWAFSFGILLSTVRWDSEWNRDSLVSLGLGKDGTFIEKICHFLPF